MLRSKITSVYIRTIIPEESKLVKNDDKTFPDFQGERPSHPTYYLPEDEEDAFWVGDVVLDDLVLDGRADARQRAGAGAAHDALPGARVCKGRKREKLIGSHEWNERTELLDGCDLSRVSELNFSCPLGIT